MTENKEIDTQLWKEYRSALFRFILTRVDDPAMAEDIVQDVLIKVYEQLNTLKDREKILPWMYQITRNAIVDHYRKYRPTEDIDKVVLIEETQTEDNVAKELAQCLLPWVSQLPPNYRQAVTMSELDGLTQQEVAQRQGLSVSGAKSRVQRGRKLLKKRLMACCRIELDRQGNVFNYECENC
ncbi:MAG: RNA polymerase sigma factor SigZ [Candidatus Thiodiazotropha sp. (ex Dulcina madagascariensis)]|nr:RNA polymerase sigma factor SigZ [Candidatus Thiodiazotropha sp. (ex Dulcina madagascariensis)]